jgi:DNA-binding FadR family transcriptional regulator
MTDTSAESAATPAEATSTLSKLSVPKASDVLADRLRHQIFTGELAEGAILPNERLLASTTGLSRGSVRDALRALEVEGLVHTRPGRAGGTFVRRPDASTFERNLNILVGGQGVRFSALVEAREAIEPAAAALAAEHRRAEDLDRIAAATEQMNDAIAQVQLFQRLNVDWHLTIVQATHNEIMHAYVGSLWRAIGRATFVVDFHGPETLSDTMKAHRAIEAAIRKGDPKRAFSAMTKHAHAYREEVYRHNLSNELLPPPDVPWESPGTALG